MWKKLITPNSIGSLIGLIMGVTGVYISMINREWLFIGLPLVYMSGRIRGDSRSLSKESLLK